MKTKLLEGKQLAIVGGGPGGLTLARLLQLEGISVKVYERDPNQQYRQQGATLDLHAESGLKALKAAGLLQAFKEAYRPGADRFTITDKSAVIHYTERDEVPSEDFDSIYARPEIDRGPLRDLLIASLQKDTMIWDAKFASMQKNGDGWDLVFENGLTAYADVVVAADGASSRLRKYITDISRIYSGATIVEGNIYNAAVNAPHLWELTAGGKVYALGSNKSIVLSAKGEGSLSFYTSTLEPEEWARTSGIDFEDKEQVAAWFKTRYADWSDDWHEIFQSNESYFTPRPQYYFPQTQSWQSLPNLTMIGDAAHASPPYGEGVNQAMLDALELYEAICEGTFSNLKEAISTFEQGMLKRTSIITDESLQMLKDLHSDNNLQFMVDFFESIK